MRRPVLAAVSAVVLLAAFGVGACTSDAEDNPDNVILDDDGPTGYVEPLPTRTVSLTIRPGHCWVDPVRVDGELWGVDRRDQFGYGGGVPKGWSEQGIAAEHGGHLVFTADKGAIVRLWPVGHRFYSDPTAEGAGCD